VTPIIGGLIEAALNIIDKVLPDPQAKLDAKLKILAMQQAGEFKEIEADLQLAQGQMEINKIEAAAQDPFKSGWRPFIGWVCGTGFATQFIVAPWGTWIAALYGKQVAFPVMDMSQMMPLLFGMLGLGAYRTYEKISNVRASK
jgi:hypothetical protein